MRRIVLLLASMGLAVLLIGGIALVGLAETAQAAFPGENGKVAFESDRNGNVEIYTMNADGTGQTNITSNSAFDTQPAWSPDGNKIAFMSTRNGYNQIYTMNVDGTNPTNITNNSAIDYAPNWFPDATKIAFTSDQEGDGIYTMNADSTNQTKLANTYDTDTFPVWSPDGTKIVFRSDRDRNVEIYTMSANGSNRTKLTNNGAYVSAPDWQPIPSTYDFSGFFSPVNNPPMLNKAKPGSSIPVKFSLGEDEGLDIFSTGYPKSHQIGCDSTASIDSIEQTVTAGASSLSYDATTDQYTYVWKTEKAWKDTCRQFTMKLDDGSTHSANFKFK